MALGSAEAWQLLCRKYGLSAEAAPAMEPFVLCTADVVLSCRLLKEHIVCAVLLHEHVHMQGASDSFLCLSCREQMIWAH